MRIKLNDPPHFLISRTDSIGDVMLTLPLCAFLKMQFPDAKITFLGRNYTKDIIKCYKAVDEVLSLDELQVLTKSDQVAKLKSLQIDVFIHVFPKKDLACIARKAKIPYRIGTSHRLFHWLTCNIRPDFTRKSSPFHEAQLNFELIRPLGIKVLPSFDQLNDCTELFRIASTELPKEIQDKLFGKKYVVLHPKSQGSAKEWPMENYLELAEELACREIYTVFTGTENEGVQFRSLLPNNPWIIDSTGKLSIEQLLVLIKNAKSLVACSTGPLHLAGFAGIQALGLFSSKRPIHPGRWKPLGRYSQAMVFDENCTLCVSGAECVCIGKIAVSTVLFKIFQ